MSIAKGTALRFHEFADSGCCEDDGYRWMVDVEWPSGSDGRELCRGRPAESCHPTRIVRCETPGPTEDMPWGGCLSPPIVSDRLRRLIDEHAPGAAQFLPVRMFYEDRPLDLPPYWLANWLFLEDCIDWQRSVYDEDLLHPGTFSFALLVIDPSLTKDRKILRIFGFNVITLIRSDLRQILVEEGITGCQYYRIWHTGDALPTVKPSPPFYPWRIRTVDKEPIPAERVNRVDEWIRGKVPMAEARFVGELPPEALRQLIIEVGGQVGVDWGPGKAEKLCAWFLEAEAKATRTHSLVIDLHEKRRMVYFHYYIHEVDAIRFAFWGPTEFIAMVEREAGARS